MDGDCGELPGPVQKHWPGLYPQHPASLSWRLPGASWEQELVSSWSHRTCLSALPSEGEMQPAYLSL